LKVSLCGLRSAGKTSLVKCVFEGKDWSDIKNLKPTQLVETMDYTYRGLLKVTTFDLGGQRDFLERYYTPVLAPSIFGNVTAFFYIIDSSNPSVLDESSREFERAQQYLRRYSPDSRIFIILTKLDLAKVTLQDVKKLFGPILGGNNVPFYGVSVRDGSARVIVGKLLDEVMPVEAKNKVTALEQILETFNLEVRANASMVVNKADGLEIATVCTRGLDSKYLEYYSVKLLFESLPKLKNVFVDLKRLGFIGSDDVSLSFWDTTKDFILVKDIDPEVALVVITPSATFELGRTLLLANEISSRIVQILGTSSHPVEHLPAVQKKVMSWRD
jgi:predicted regulator of Ras-like GTPase activity (Roadblock/LC7/MglB family)